MAKNILRATLSSYLDTQYWDKKFLQEKTSWGFEPADSAILASDLFLKHQVKDILIPGIGYGRNAKVFLDHGIKVTGIEISQKAIDLAKAEGQLNIKIHRGSVAQMPFDSHPYDGIFCYALAHLLNKPQRSKFIQCCYDQLLPGGFMIFTVISTESPMFGTGKLLSKNRYKIANGLNVYFYDEHSILKEFRAYGLLEFKSIDEPIKNMKDEPALKCFYVICKR